MQLRHVMSTALTALSTVLLTACLSTTETGPKFTLDANAVNAQREQVAQVLRTPVLLSVFDTSFTPPASTRSAGGPIEVLLARTGALVAAHTSLRPNLSWQRATASAMAAPGSWLPAELRGKTYVRVDGAYVADGTRSAEAPPNGVRIVLYERLANDTFGTTPIGYLDLVDNSSGTKDIGVAKIGDGGGSTLATLTWTTETAGSTAGTYTIAGTLGASPKQITVGDTIAITTAATGKTTVQYTFRSAAPFASSAIVYGTPAFDADSAAPALQMGIVADGHLMYIVPAGMSPTLQGATVVLDGYAVAYIDLDAIPKYVSPSGGPPAVDMLAFFDAASALARSMPMASSLVDDAMGMANRLSY